MVKHAAAASVTVQLTQAGQQVQVRIGDAGRGFDIQDVRGGMGPGNIGERGARLGEGQSNQVIARNLTISDATVRAHVSSILAKLNVTNRTQAALIAREHLRQ